MNSSWGYTVTVLDSIRSTAGNNSVDQNLAVEAFRAIKTVWWVSKYLDSPENQIKELRNTPVAPSLQKYVSNTELYQWMN